MSVQSQPGQIVRKTLPRKTNRKTRAGKWRKVQGPEFKPQPGKKKKSVHLQRTGIAGLSMRSTCCCTVHRVQALWRALSEADIPKRHSAFLRTQAGVQAQKRSAKARADAGGEGAARRHHAALHTRMKSCAAFRARAPPRACSAAPGHAPGPPSASSALMSCWRFPTDSHTGSHRRRGGHGLRGLGGGGRHLLVWDAGCSWLLWKGYRNSSLLPLLPELTRITLMGLVLSPIVSGRGLGTPDAWARTRSRRAGHRTHAPPAALARLPRRPGTRAEAAARGRGLCAGAGGCARGRSAVGSRGPAPAWIGTAGAGPGRSKRWFLRFKAAHSKAGFNMCGNVTRAPILY
jgi:hypothetical protein